MTSENVWRTSMSRWVRPPSLLFVHRMWAVPSQRLQPRQVYWTDSCFAALYLPRRLLFILYLLPIDSKLKSTIFMETMPKSKPVILGIYKLRVKADHFDARWYLLHIYLFCYIAIQTLACSLDSLHRVSTRGSIIAILLRWTCFWRPEPWYNDTNMKTRLPPQDKFMGDRGTFLAWLRDTGNTRCAS